MDIGKEKRYIFILTLVMMLIMMVVSICTGDFSLTLQDLIDGNELSTMVFLNLRLPRTLMVVISGVGLSMAGSAFQTIFKNPLASPDIIGVASGANLGAAIAIVFLGAGSFHIIALAFLGGMLAVFCALGLSAVANRRAMASFVIAGIVVNALAQSMLMTVKYLADPEKQLAALEFWTMGSFGSVTAEKFLIALPIVCIGIIGLYFFRWKMEILSLSDDEANALGVSVTTTRYCILFFATLMVASVVAITGMIAFIGLMAPHLARMILKRNNFSTVIFSGMIGSVLLLIADCLAKTLGETGIPISILTSLIGAPFLAWLICRKDQRI